MASLLIKNAQVVSHDDELINQDVLVEDGKIAAIGSGGNYAISAARALDRHANLDEETLVKESLKIASELCIYTNDHIKTFVLEGTNA